MALFFSPESLGFFHAGIHDQVPADAVPVTTREHARLLDGQASGRAIVAGPSGRPMLEKLAAPKLAELRERAIGAVKREARRRILAVASLERQSNDNAAIALSAVASLLGNVPDDRAALMVALRRRAAIEAVRTASDRLEATIARAGARELAALDLTSPTLWPEG